MVVDGRVGLWKDGDWMGGEGIGGEEITELMTLNYIIT